MTRHYASLLLSLAALSGCSALQSPPEPAIPSSTAARQPINRTVEERAPGPEESTNRVPRMRADTDPANRDAAQETRYPVLTRYVFGVSTPYVYCAVHHVCDVELQAGERITLAPRIGDKARWGVDVIVQGQGAQETPHLTLMPLEAGIATSLVVVTTKRTYHLALRATQKLSMLHVGFVYPEELTARWNASAPASGK